MRFYIISSKGETVGCEMTLRSAKDLAKEWQLTETTITLVDVAISAENIRRLLGDLGGYSKESKFYD